MKTGVKILGVVALAVGGYKLNQLLKTANTADKTSINVTKLNKPTIKNGALNLSVDVAFDNPTDHTMNLKKPYLIARFNGSQVGNSKPSNEYTKIKANDRTIIKGINIQVPFLNLGFALVSLIAGKVPKMTFEISVLAEADGITHTDTQQFTV